MTETNEVVRWFIGSLCQIVFHLTLKEIVFEAIGFVKVDLHSSDTTASSQIVDPPPTIWDS